MHRFNVEDVVWHLVHKVKMRVVKVLPTGELVCEWKDGRGIQRLEFSPDVLQSWEDHEAERQERRERAARSTPTHAVTSRPRL